MNIGVRKTFAMPDGKEITIETGKLAKQAHGSVVVTMGGTMLLAAVVSNEEAKEGVDFLPLTVEYQEKYGSAGRFPGGFFKREARPSENEILTCRLVDRALRPLFPDDYHADTTITINLISSDRLQLPDSLACLAASAALAVSNIPFNGPVSEVRVSRVNGKLVVNPTIEELKQADMDIMVAASQESIVMVEGEMKEVQENDMLEAIKFAHEAIKVQLNAINELAALVAAAEPKRVYSHETHDEDIRSAVSNFCFDKCVEVARSGNANKKERSEAFKAIKNEFIAQLSEEEAAKSKSLIGVYFHDVEKKAVRQVILNDGIRLDGRNLTTIRPIWGEVDYLPFAHGSAVFTRGETQSLTTVTLGTKMDEQIIDGAITEGKSNFLLHYNFPSFSTGESRPNRGTSRREVGHGNLALRALKPMMPASDVNPYTIRIVSDILESNGSSSMATVCAGTLALMDAGVKIKKPVSGIAMGLITDGSKYAVLSDILGDEDHLGDMDFKVTGTKDGITACQMDIKVNGLSYEIMLNAMNQAKEGRLHILGEMEKVITAPREDYKPHAPRIVEIRIPKEFIGAVIGPGGKIIQEMQKETQTVISIEEVGDQGVVQISSTNKANIDKALAKIRGITATPEVGEVYSGKVKSIMPFGAFVEILPGKDGLLHISEVEWRRLESMDGILKEGDIVDVKLIEVDKKTGKFKLSRKALLPKPEPVNGN
jgi:polyribonucleotide nucleotidyltransferase